MNGRILAHRMVALRARAWASICRAFAVAAALALISLAFAPAPSHASNCNGTSTGLVPLTDLGAGTYKGFQGGLYAGGSNHRPQAHNDAGINIATSLVPLDTLGNPDPTNGRIVMISIGMSNCTMEFSTLVPLVTADPYRNPPVRAIDCALGGQSADRINTPTAAYWDTVRTRLRSHGSSSLQAQVVWIKEADASPTGGFPAATDTLLRNLGTVVRILKQKLPNVKLCYLTSRIYAGYATSTLNPEPYAYESGFAVKGLVDAQINGVDSLNYDPARGTVYAPWMAWGPYLWADGLNPRSDGFIWRCSEFESDGTHPDTLGRRVVADSLLTFFRLDQTTRPWYVSPTAGVGASTESAALQVSISPNPFRNSMEVAFTPPAGMRWTLEVRSAEGRPVAQLGAGTGSGARRLLRWSERDTRGRRIPSGTYWLRYVPAQGPSRSWRVVFLAGS